MVTALPDRVLIAALPWVMTHHNGTSRAPLSVYLEELTDEPQQPPISPPGVSFECLSQRRSALSQSTRE